MLRMVACDSRRARTMPRRSPFDQRDTGALDGDIGTRSHRDADICLGERRRVVYAIAGHGHLRAPCLCNAPSQICAFSSGSTSARTSSIPSLDAIACCGTGVVAGDHDDFQPLCHVAPPAPPAWSP